MLIIALSFGAGSLLALHKLDDAVRKSFYSDFVSIESAYHMEKALHELELSEEAGQLDTALPRSRTLFQHWLGVEDNSITEEGEGELVADIKERWQKLLSELESRPPYSTHAKQFTALHDDLEKLALVNKVAMVVSNSRASRINDLVAWEFAIALTLLLLVATAISLTLARNITKPLSELSDRLSRFSLPGQRERLNEQPLAELQSVASAFNKMAERLEQFEKINVDRLVAEKNKTETILESIEDGIVLVDGDGAVAHINEVAATILGVKRENALGKPFDRLDSTLPHYARVREALGNNSNESADLPALELDVEVRGGNHSYTLKTVPLVRGDGPPLGTILVLQNIDYLRDRANLVATLSHELKTPLTSLAVAVELLQDARTKLDGKEQDLLQTINEDTGILRRVADDLLALARGEAGSIAIHCVPIDLVPLIHSVVRTFAAQAEQKGIALTASIEESMPEISADPVKLSWVVANLVSNAVRYTPNGGSVTVSALHLSRNILLEVKDTGAGVAPEILDHVFERFVRWEVNGAASGSAGLGLAIAKEIVEAHGGRILVDSTPGKGSCFKVELPIPAEGSWREF